MIEWFKDGKTLPKRYVWEIVLGAHEHFAKNESLVDVDLEAGVTCDVIGDVHGKSLALFRIQTVNFGEQGNFMIYYISSL
jgi:serine/threonine-protein phosphatase 5